MKNTDATGKIIGCAYKIYNKMGFGFLESVYEKCMEIELRKTGLKAERQVSVPVWYENEIVGEFVPDMIVENNIILELKSVKSIVSAHETQLVNYLVATKKPIGLVINFGVKSVEIKRKYREMNSYMKDYSIMHSKTVIK